MKNFRQFLITENRINWLKKNVTDIDTSHDHLADKHEPHEVIDHFAEHDPTRKKIYTQWMVNQYKKQNVRQEDAGDLHKTLSDFENHKHKLEKRDINQYKHPSDLKDAVEPHIKQEKKTNPFKSDAHEHYLKSGSIDKIHSSKDLDAYRLNDVTAAHHYGKGTSWCTRDPMDGGHHGAAGAYLQHDPLFVLHDKKNNRRYQLHFHTDQFSNEKDQMRPFKDIVSKYPQVKNIDEFKRGAYAYSLAKNDHEAKQAIQDHGLDITRRESQNPGFVKKEHYDNLIDHPEDGVFRRFVGSKVGGRRNDLEPRHIDKILDHYEQGSHARQSKVRENIEFGEMSLQDHHIDRLLNSSETSHDVGLSSGGYKLKPHHVDKIIDRGEGEALNRLASRGDKHELNSNHYNRILNKTPNNAIGQETREHIASKKELDTQTVDKLLHPDVTNSNIKSHLSKNYDVPLKPHHIDKIIEKDGLVTTNENLRRMAKISHREDLSDHHVDHLLSKFKESQNNPDDSFGSIKEIIGENLSSNPALKHHHIEELMNSGHKGVMADITSNPNLDQGHVDRLFDHHFSNKYGGPLKYLARAHPDKIRQEHVDKIMNTGSKDSGWRDRGWHAKVGVLETSDKLRPEHINDNITRSDLAKNPHLDQKTYEKLFTHAGYEAVLGVGGDQTDTMSSLASNPSVKGKTLDHIANFHTENPTGADKPEDWHGPDIPVSRRISNNVIDKFTRRDDLKPKHIKALASSPSPDVHRHLFMNQAHNMTHEQMHGVLDQWEKNKSTLPVPDIRTLRHHMTENPHVPDEHVDRVTNILKQKEQERGY